MQQLMHADVNEEVQINTMHQISPQKTPQSLQRSLQTPLTRTSLPAGSPLKK